MGHTPMVPAQSRCPSVYPQYVCMYVCFGFTLCAIHRYGLISDAHGMGLGF